MDNIVVKIGADISDFRRDMNKMGGVATQQLRSVDKSVNQVSTQMNRMEAETRQTRQQMQQLGGTASREFREMTTASQRTTGAIQGLKSMFLGLGAVLLAGLGFHQLIASAREWSALASEQEKATAGLNQTLESMGRTTPDLSRKIQDYASHLQSVGIAEDDAVVAGAKMLATFKDIKDDALLPTMDVMADLSAAWGIDMPNAARLLGMASMGNIGMLSRYGITLSETAKKSKDFSLILADIKTQVEGQAAALAATDYGGMVQFQNVIGDVKEGFGAFVNTITGTAGRAMVSFFGDSEKAIKGWVEANRELIKLKTIEYMISLTDVMLLLAGAISATGDAWAYYKSSVFWSINQKLIDDANAMVDSFKELYRWLSGSGAPSESSKTSFLKEQIGDIRKRLLEIKDAMLAVQDTNWRKTFPIEQVKSFGSAAQEATKSITEWTDLIKKEVSHITSIFEQIEPVVKDITDSTVDMADEYAKAMEKMDQETAQMTLSAVEMVQWEADKEIRIWQDMVDQKLLTEDEFNVLRQRLAEDSALKITDIQKKEAEEREKQERESLRAFEVAWGNTLSTIAGLLADFMTGAEISWQSFFDTLKRIAAQALAQTFVDIVGKWIKDIVGGIFGGGGGFDILSLLGKIPGLSKAITWLAGLFGGPSAAAAGAGGYMGAGGAAGAGAGMAGLGGMAAAAGPFAAMAAAFFIMQSIQDERSRNRWSARVGRMSIEERAAQEEQYYPWMLDWQRETAAAASAEDYPAWFRAQSSSAWDRFRWNILAQSLGHDPATWAQQRMTPEQYQQYQLQTQQSEAMTAIEGLSAYGTRGPGGQAVVGQDTLNNIISEMADLNLGDATKELLAMLEAGTIDYTEAMRRLRQVVMEATEALSTAGDGIIPATITTAEEFESVLTDLRDRTLSGQIWTDLLGEDFMSNLSELSQSIMGGLQGTFYDMIQGFIDALDAGTLSFDDIDEIVQELTERMGELTTLTGIMRAETDAINSGVDLLTAKTQTLNALYASLVWGQQGTAEWEQMLQQFMTTQGDVSWLTDLMTSFQQIQDIIMGGGWREDYAARGYETAEDYLRALFAEAAELAEALGLEDPMVQVADAIEALQTVLQDLIDGLTVDTAAQAAAAAAAEADAAAQAANTAAQAANTEAINRNTNAIAGMSGGGARGYQHGGMVQGYGLPMGAAIPIIAHVGEVVVPRGASAGINITINANGLSLDSPAILQKVATTISKELAYQSRAARN